MDNITLNAKAVSLVQRAIDGVDGLNGLGSMSCAIYDTAWVSLVTKFVDGKERGLFPQCFQYLLEMQAVDGSWGLDDCSQIDGILNTAASILSLKRHLEQPLDFDGESMASIEERVDRAAASLQSQLSTWDVAATVHVGFEMIVPAILAYLQRFKEVNMMSPSFFPAFHGAGSSLLSASSIAGADSEARLGRVISSGVMAFESTLPDTLTELIISFVQVFV